MSREQAQYVIHVDAASVRGFGATGLEAAQDALHNLAAEFVRVSTENRSLQEGLTRVRLIVGCQDGGNIYEAIRELVQRNAGVTG